MWILGNIQTRDNVKDNKDEDKGGDKALDKGLTKRTRVIINKNKSNNNQKEDIETRPIDWLFLLLFLYFLHSASYSFCMLQVFEQGYLLTYTLLS